MEELYRLRDKLELLVAAYQKAKEEITSLETTIDEQKNEIAQLNQNCENLEEKLKSKSLNQYFDQLPEAKRKQAKEQLETVLTMIKKNLDSLK